MTRGSTDADHLSATPAAVAQPDGKVAGAPRLRWLALTTLFVVAALFPDWHVLFLPPVVVLVGLAARRNLVSGWIIADIRSAVGVPLAAALVLAVLAAASAAATGRHDLVIPLLVSFSVFVVVAIDVRSRSELVATLSSMSAAGAVASLAFVLLARRQIPADGLPPGVAPESFRFGFTVTSMGSVNHVAYSVALCLAAWAAWVLLKNPATTDRGRAAVALVPLVGLSTVFMSETRGALLAVVLAWAGALLGRVRGPLLRRLTLVGLGLIALLSLTGWLGVLAERAGLDSLLGRDTGNLSGRLDLWQRALDLAVHRPVLGYGLGSAELEVDGVAVHNLFLSVWLAMGLVGVGVYLGWVLACAARRDGSASSLHRVVAVPAVLLLGSLPIWASGAWEWSAMNWAVLGACAAATGLLPPAAPGDRRSLVSSITGRRPTP